MPIQLVENAVVAGRFRLNRLIGRGGMGSVWQATHLGLDIPCAVKFIEGEYSGMAEAQARFEREAKAAAQLRSPHVVQILDHGVCEGTPYIAMELLDGEDLGKRITKVGKMHPREVNAVMAQVCRALGKAHQLGIVHRDLKPDNIFLVRDDDREIAKVLDFGIAKHNSQALEGSNTKTGAMLGTPYYMSPEQAQGIKSVDFRSDLWSLAVIVYQCITGVLPFESEALGDLLVRIIVQPLPVPSQVAEVPPGFDQWWAKASSRDPAGRFQSAKEFAESLQMVFGLSQLTDVMDRSALKAALGGTPNPAGPNPLMLTPSGYAAQQPYGATPPPVTGGGMAGARTPPPGMGPPSNLSATTGAPMARTFGESQGAPAGPKRGAVMAIVGGATALLVVVAIAGAVVMSRGKGSAPAAAGPGPAQAVAATPPVPAPPAAPPEPAVATPAPAPVAVATPPVAAAPTGATAANDATKGTHRSRPAAPAGSTSARPATSRPAAPAQPKDLGF